MRTELKCESLRFSLTDGLSARHGSNQEFDHAWRVVWAFGESDIYLSASETTNRRREFMNAINHYLEATCSLEFCAGDFLDACREWLLPASSKKLLGKDFS